MDDTIKYCSIKDKDECSRTKILHVDPLFVIPSGVSQTDGGPSICTYSNECTLEYSDWKNNPLRSTIQNQVNDKGLISSRIFSAEEKLANAEEALRIAEEAAEAAALAASNDKGNTALAKVAEEAALAASKAKSDLDKLNIDIKETSKVNISENINKMMDLGISDEVIKQIGGELGRALKENDTRRAYMEAKNLSNRLEFFIQSGDAGATDIINKRNRIQELLYQINELNEKLQAEGLELDGINSNTLLSGRVHGAPT